MFPTTQNSATSLAAQLAESKVNETAAGGGKAFLKFDYKTGDYLFGRAAEVVTGDTIAVNTYAIQHGWVLWHNSTPHKTMVGFSQELPAQPAPMGDDYPSEGRSFEGRFIDDEDTILVFEGNSYGIRKGVDTLLNAIKAKAAMGEVNFLFPLVELDSESYKSKQGGTIHNPVFKIVGWMDANGNEEGEKPKAIEAKAEEPEAEAAPVRRRRRSA